MPDPFIIPESPAAEFNDSDWKELIEQAKPGGPDVASNQGCEATLVITVPMAKARAAQRRILGYSKADAGSPYRLRRPSLPWRHPRYPWLWSDAVSIAAHNPAGVTGNMTGSTVNNAPWVAPIEPTLAPAKTASYTRADITVKFNRAPGDIMGDDDPFFTPGQEWQRFVKLEEMDPTLELIVAEGGADNTSFYFAETSTPAPTATAGGPLTGEVEGARFPGGVVERRQTTKYTLCWRGVSLGYISDTDLPFLHPAKILAGMGKVNSVPFIGSAGRKKDTLLFDSLKLRLYEAPVRTSEVTGLWQCDLYLGFNEFDPDRGTIVQATGVDPVSPGSRRYGWQLMPWRRGGWFLATRAQTVGGGAGTYSGRPAFDTYDMHKIFSHVLAP